LEVSSYFGFLNSRLAAVKDSLVACMSISLVALHSRLWFAAMNLVHLYSSFVSYPINCKQIILLFWDSWWVQPQHHICFCTRVMQVADASPCLLLAACNTIIMGDSLKSLFTVTYSATFACHLSTQLLLRNNSMAGHHHT
jgi:hypothetical protein